MHTLVSNHSSIKFSKHEIWLCYIRVKSASSIILFTSSSVGFWPRACRTVFNSLWSINPLASLSKILNDSHQSAKHTVGLESMVKDSSAYVLWPFLAVSCEFWGRDYWLGTVARAHYVPSLNNHNAPVSVRSPPVEKNYHVAL